MPKGTRNAFIGPPPSRSGRPTAPRVSSPADTTTSRRAGNERAVPTRPTRSARLRNWLRSGSIEDERDVVAAIVGVRLRDDHEAIPERLRKLHLAERGG